MTVHAYHDRDGTIRAFVAFNGPVDGALMMAARPGLLVTEVVGLSFEKGIPDVKQLEKITAGIKIPTPTFQWPGQTKRKRR